MRLLHKFYHRWGSNSITRKFGLGVGLLSGLILLVSLTGYFSQQYVRKADNSIKISSDIQRLILEMDRGMEKARRLHSFFFLNYPIIGLRQAHELYAQKSIEQTAKVINLSKSLKDMTRRPLIREIFKENNIDLNLYLSSAKRFAETSIKSYELTALLAAPETGLENLLDQYLNSLEEQLQFTTPEIFALFLNMKDFIKRYQIAHKRHLMQSSFNLAFRLRQKIGATSNLTANEQAEIYANLNKYKRTAEKILEVDTAIKAKFNDFSLQQHATNIVSNALIKLAKDEVAKSHQLIRETHDYANILLISVTIIGLLLTGLIFILMNFDIVLRIVRLTEAAEKLRRGDFNMIIDDATQDEIGQLGNTFNFMAVKIKKLIENLEEKVAQRTAELTASERHFRQLFEHSSNGIAVYEAIDNGENFIITDINPTVEKLEGVKRQDILAKKVTDVFPAIEDFGLLDIFRQVLRTGKASNHPMSFYNDGRLQAWRENLVYKLPDNKIVAVYDDRTAEKEAEIKKNDLKKQLQRAKKMEAIGLLAGGVAHDLNNILAGIVGYPELILTDLPEESKLREPILAIHDSGKRAAAVVADLLTVARGVANTKEEVDLNTIITEYLHSPEAQKLFSLHPDLQCLSLLDPRPKYISCSQIHVKKCIMNLVTNAMEAIKEIGKVTLKTSNQEIDSKQGAKKGLQPGEYVVLTVADTGTGISPEDIEHIFEPFYSKKVMGFSGTGLGLAIVWNSMQDHGGIAQVVSSKEGTLFHLYFPAISPPAPENKEKKQPIAALTGHNEHILIVDDEPQLRNLAKNILERSGYQPITASSGEEAITYLSENSVDLLIIDMIMDPGINGRQTYEQILKIHPDQKALITSGFSESIEVKKAMKLGACGFLKKPYSVTELKQLVDKALQAK